MRERYQLLMKIVVYIKTILRALKMKLISFEMILDQSNYIF